MISKELKVENASGLHARPATLVVKEASNYKASIYFLYNGRRASAKSIIGLLSLSINRGADICIEIDGEDENIAMDSITNLIANLDE